MQKKRPAYRGHVADKNKTPGRDGEPDVVGDAVQAEGEESLHPSVSADVVHGRNCLRAP
jgi:hypothetical protein